MTPEDFQEVVQRRNSEITRVLLLKAKEYASGDDRLHNFKRAGAMQSVTPEKALLGMLSKHLVSVFDMVHDLDSDKHSSLALWDEKICDAVNYLILLEALIVERYPNPV